MKKYLLFILIFVCTNALAQTTKAKGELLAITKLSKNIQLGYKNYSKKYKLYYNPRVIKNGKTYSIKGFDSNRGSDLLTFLSPNKKFIVISTIEKGFVGEGKEKFLHENSFCYIVNLNVCKVETQMQSDCGGEWNEQNKWINGSKIIFDGE